MDWLNAGNYILSYVKKYRFVLLIFLIGMLLMLFPENKKTETEALPPSESEGTSSLEDNLSTLLSQVEGAGKTLVLLTQLEGEQYIYQTDTDTSGSESSHDNHADTVILTDSSRGESGLVRQIIPPKYQGAVILTQGADSPAVCLSLVEAVSDATGLTSNNITVLKMK